MKKSILNILFAALFAASCTVLETDQQEKVPFVPSSAPKVPIEFQIAMPNNGSATKSFNDLPEIKNVVLVVFSDAGYFNEWVVAEKEGTGLANTNETVYTLSAKLSMSEGSRLRVHVIANCPSDLVGNPPITGSGTDDIEDAVISRIQSKLGDRYKPSEDSDDTFNIEDGYWQKIILPFGIEAEKEENGNTSEDTYKKDQYGNLIPTELTKNQFKMVSPIPLVRNFARVQLINHAENFEIAKIGLAYAPAQGVIAPILSTPYKVDQWGARVVVTESGGYEDGDGWHDGTFTATLVSTDATRPAEGVNGLHLLGHELKDPSTGADLLGDTVSNFYDEIFMTNYQNLPLEPLPESADNYDESLSWRLLTEAPYNYGGFNTTPLTFAANPQSDEDLAVYNQSSPQYLYVYERPKPRIISGKAENATRIIIKGKFTGDTQYKYYPVDILDDDGSYSALLRNHTYIVVLQGVAEDAGETDIKKAPDSTGSNVSDDPRTSDLNEVSDGTSSIAVSYIDTTIIKSGTYSLMYRYIGNIKGDVGQTNNDVRLKIGYDGTSAGFQEGTESSTGATFAGTTANPTVSIEMDGSSPKLYIPSGNRWLVATTAEEKKVAWSKITYTTVGDEGSIFTYASSGSIRVEGSRGLHRDVRVNITPIKAMKVECKDKYVQSVSGEEENLIVYLPKDLPRSLFPLELKIEAEDATINPHPDDNMPVEAGPSIVDSKEGQSSFFYIKTVSRTQYTDELEVVNIDGTDMIAVPCKFKTIRDNSATRIWVSNPYFSTQSDNFFNYKKRYFNDLAFGNYTYGQKDITFSFNFDQDHTGVQTSFWDNNTSINQADYRILPRQVTLKLDNITPAMSGSNYVDGGITRKQNNYFVLNLPSNSNADSYIGNLRTLHFVVTDDTKPVSITLTTDDLETDPDNPEFIPNPDLYADATLTKAVSTYGKCSISNMHFESASGETITQAPTGETMVYFCFDYQNENLQAVTFQLTNLSPVNTQVTQEGATYTFTPTLGSGNSQRIPLNASGTATAQLTQLAVASDQYNTPGTRSFSLSRFANYTLTITPTTATVNVGGTLQLTATLGPAGAPGISSATFTWSSNNEAVATVDANGLVRGVASGSATITARATINGSTVSASRTVTVRRKVWHAASYTLSFTSNNDGNATSFTTSPQNVVFENFDRGGNNNNRYKMMGAREYYYNSYNDNGYHYYSGTVTITRPPVGTYLESRIIGVTMTYNGGFDDNPVSYSGDGATLTGGSAASWGTTNTSSTSEVVGYNELVISHACTNLTQYNNRNRLTGMTVYYGYFTYE